MATPPPVRERRRFRSTRILMLQRRMRVAQTFAQVVAELRANGRSCPERDRPGVDKLVAERLGVSRHVVEDDLRRLKIEWRETHQGIIDQEQTAMLRRLEVMEREAWQQWERSKINADLIEHTGADVVEQLTWTPADAARHAAGQPRLLGRVVRKRRVADPRWLEIIRGIEADRRAIWGLDAPKRVTPTDTHGNPLDGVFRQIAEQWYARVLAALRPPVVALPAPVSFDGDGVAPRTRASDNGGDAAEPS